MFHHDCLFHWHAHVIHLQSVSIQQGASSTLFGFTSNLCTHYHSDLLVAACFCCFDWFNDSIWDTTPKSNLCAFGGFDPAAAGRLILRLPSLEQFHFCQREMPRHVFDSEPAENEWAEWVNHTAGIYQAMPPSEQHISSPILQLSRFRSLVRNSAQFWYLVAQIFPVCDSDAEW